MKSAVFSLVVTVLVPMAVAAQPATQPSTTAPAGQPASILIVPFNPPGSGQLPWVGRSLARDLSDAVASATRARVDVYEGAPVRDRDEARRLAQSRGDSVVILGDARATADQVRVTGEVLDASSGSLLGSLNATAPATNLFPLEDQLAGQAIAALPRECVNTLPTAPSSGYAAAQRPAYQSYVYPDYGGYPPSPYATYGYYSYPRTYYDYGYAYPSWWWYGPYVWYGPVFYHGYWHHHHWDGDHDWDDHFGRPWRHGFAGPRLGGSRYSPHGPTLGHIGGAVHAGGGHER